MRSIRFENVSKAFDQLVLDDFSMEIHEGETKIILGGSGSGKTTILKLVLGLVKPDSGQIFVGDREITRLRETELAPVRNEIGMVFQEGALFDFLTVGENVAYRLLEQNKPIDEVEEVVRRLLGFVGLEHAIDKMPEALSGGMRRRVAIARALVGKPKVMLYDEPTAGLDPITARTICDLMIELRDLEGVSSIFVTHDLKTARNMASEYAYSTGENEIHFQPEGEEFCLINTRFVILKSGRILFEGSDEELRAEPDSYIREFLT